MEQFFTPTEPDPEPGLALEDGFPWKRFLWETAQTVMLSLLLFLLINSVSARIRVQSISMQPTLFEKDLVLINRLAYRLGQPDHRDIVVFDPPITGAEEPYIKRVIGLPGDTVRIENRQVFINGVAQTETYVAASPAYSGEWTVPEGQLFVLGDNRNQSSDSHSWGMVPLENVLGKAELLYWPLQRLKWLDPSIAFAAGQ